ncbi:sensor histidine kinase [Roseimarinus sediminis]|uniref:sensor histidine kinase n=1 Tax=Roseimarinus sediminis TaxID=1610899 RepID=UPI003D211437
MKNRKEAIILFLLIFSLSIAFILYYEINNKRMEILDDYHLVEGIIDLSSASIDEHQLIALQGEAAFYWKRLLSPADFKSDSLPLPDTFVDIPGIWNGTLINGDQINGAGFATYRFIIKTPDNAQYALRIKEFDSAYNLWTNGNNMIRSGVVGKSKEETRPSWQRNEIVCTPIDGQIEVLIQIANFSHRKGGAEDRILFGKTYDIMKFKKRQVTFNALLLGILIMLSIYHFILFSFRQKDISALIFSALCFFMALRLMSTGEKLLIEFFPNISWAFGLRIEYLSYKLVLPLMLTFFYRFYPAYFSKTYLNIVYALSAAFCLIVLLTPPAIFTYTPLFYQVLIALTAIYLLIVLFKTALKKEENAGILFSGYLLFFLILINDILYYNKVIDTSFMMHFGLFILAVSQSMVLSRQFSTAYVKVEELTLTLERHNRQLEKTVEERTAQLVMQKNEIETQAEKLKTANEQLIELTTLKDNLTEMIIHDLKNPLNIILNFSNDERVIFAGNQMLNLVQNLLDVQRYETSTIQLSRETISLNQLINNAVYQMQYLIKEKGIKMVFKIKQDYRLTADREMLNRVLVNLLSNALKFTPVSGKVLIQTSLANKQLKLCITDNGPGIPADQRHLVFQKFGQYLIRSAGRSNSTGIGLSFCKLAIEAHGGHISFSSDLGKGTTFCVQLDAESASGENKTFQVYEAKAPDIQLDKESRHKLMASAEELKMLELYEIGRIKRIITQIDPEESEQVGRWLSALRQALLNANREQFNRLIKMVVE